jgi:hypothetical protein
MRRGRLGLVEQRLHDDAERLEALRRRFPAVTDAAVADITDRHRNVVATEAWEELPINEEWMSMARFVYDGPDLVIGELRIFPREPVGPFSIPLDRAPGIWSAELLGNKARVPRGGVSVTLLRSVRLSPHRRVITKTLEEAAVERPDMFENPSTLLSGFKLPTPERPRAARRSARSDAFYAALAAQYVRALAQDPRRPIVRLARARKMKTSQMRDLIREARERGLLSQGRQGCAAGALMPRAREILRLAQSSRRRKNNP